MSSAAQALDYGDISVAPKVMFLKIISLVSLEGTFSIFFNDYLYSNCTLGPGTWAVKPTSAYMCL